MRLLVNFRHELTGVTLSHPALASLRSDHSTFCASDVPSVPLFFRLEPHISFLTYMPSPLPFESNLFSASDLPSLMSAVPSLPLLLIQHLRALAPGAPSLCNGLFSVLQLTNSWSLFETQDRSLYCKKISLNAYAGETHDEVLFFFPPLQKKKKNPKYFIKTEYENKEKLVGVLWYNSLDNDTPITPSCGET